MFMRWGGGIRGRDKKFKGKGYFKVNFLKLKSKSMA